VKNALVTGEQGGVEIRYLKTLVRHTRPAYDLKSGIQLSKLFRKIMPDILSIGTPTRREYWDGGQPFSSCALYNPHAHGHVFFGYFGRLMTRIFIWTEPITTLTTDRIIASTKMEARDYVNFKVAPRRKIAVIHTGIDLNSARNSGIPPKEVGNSLDIRE